MAGVDQMVAMAEAIDEAPSVLEDSGFRTELIDLISSTNGDFVTLAEARGIDRSRSEAWLADTQRLASSDAALEIEGAADLAVRLHAVGYILADPPLAGETDPADLLATGSVSGPGDRKFR